MKIPAEIQDAYKSPGVKVNGLHLHWDGNELKGSDHRSLGLSISLETAYNLRAEPCYCGDKGKENAVKIRK